MIPFFWGKQKTEYDVIWWREFRRVVVRVVGIPTGTHPVELALDHISDGCDVVFERGGLDRWNLWLCVAVIRVTLVGNQVGTVMAEQIGTGDNRIVVIGELDRVTADICPDMLGHDENLVTNTEERSAIRVLQREYHCTAISRSNTLDQRQYPILVKSRMRLHQVKGELDIRACESLAVIPFHAGAQSECQLRQIAGV